MNIPETRWLGRRRFRIRANLKRQNILQTQNRTQGIINVRRALEIFANVQNTNIETEGKLQERQNSMKTTENREFVQDCGRLTNKNVHSRSLPNTTTQELCWVSDRHTTEQMSRNQASRNNETNDLRDGLALVTRESETFLPSTSGEYSPNSPSSTKKDSVIVYKARCPISSISSLNSSCVIESNPSQSIDLWEQNKARALELENETSKVEFRPSTKAKVNEQLSLFALENISHEYTAREEDNEHKKRSETTRRERKRKCRFKKSLRSLLCCSNQHLTSSTNSDTSVKSASIFTPHKIAAPMVHSGTCHPIDSSYLKNKATQTLLTSLPKIQLLTLSDDKCENKQSVSISKNDHSRITEHDACLDLKRDIKRIKEMYLIPLRVKRDTTLSLKNEVDGQKRILTFSGNQVIIEVKVGDGIETIHPGMNQVEIDPINKPEIKVFPHILQIKETCSSNNMNTILNPEESPYVVNTPPWIWKDPLVVFDKKEGEKMLFNALNLFRNWSDSSNESLMGIRNQRVSDIAPRNEEMFHDVPIGRPQKVKKGRVGAKNMTPFYTVDIIDIPFSSNHHNVLEVDGEEQTRTLRKKTSGSAGADIQHSGELLKEVRNETSQSVQNLIDTHCQTSDELVKLNDSYEEKELLSMNLENSLKMDSSLQSYNRVLKSDGITIESKERASTPVTICHTPVIDSQPTSNEYHEFQVSTNEIKTQVPLVDSASYGTLPNSENMPHVIHNTRDDVLQNLPQNDMDNMAHKSVPGQCGKEIREIPKQKISATRSKHKAAGEPPNTTSDLVPRSVSTECEISKEKSKSIHKTEEYENKEKSLFQIDISSCLSRTDMLDRNDSKEEKRGLAKMEYLWNFDEKHRSQMSSMKSYSRRTTIMPRKEAKEKLQYKIKTSAPENKQEKRPSQAEINSHPKYSEPSRMNSGKPYSNRSTSAQRKNTEEKLSSKSKTSSAGSKQEKRLFQTDMNPYPKNSAEKRLFRMSPGKLYTSRTTPTQRKSPEEKQKSKSSTSAPKNEQEKRLSQNEPKKRLSCRGTPTNFESAERKSTSIRRTSAPTNKQVRLSQTGPTRLRSAPLPRKGTPVQRKVIKERSNSIRRTSEFQKEKEFSQIITRSKNTSVNLKKHETSSPAEMVENKDNVTFDVIADISRDTINVKDIQATPQSSSVRTSLSENKEINKSINADTVQINVDDKRFKSNDSSTNRERPHSFIVPQVWQDKKGCLENDRHSNDTDMQSRRAIAYIRPYSSSFTVRQSLNRTRRFELNKRSATSGRKKLNTGGEQYSTLFKGTPYFGIRDDLQKKSCEKEFSISSKGRSTFDISEDLQSISGEKELSMPIEGTSTLDISDDLLKKSSDKEYVASFKGTSYFDTRLEVRKNSSRKETRLSPESKYNYRIRGSCYDNLQLFADPSIYFHELEPNKKRMLEFRVQVGAKCLERKSSLIDEPSEIFDESSHDEWSNEMMIQEESRSENEKYLYLKKNDARDSCALSPNYTDRVIQPYQISSSSRRVDTSQRQQTGRTTREDSLLLSSHNCGSDRYSSETPKGRYYSAHTLKPDQHPQKSTFENMSEIICNIFPCFRQCLTCRRRRILYKRNVNCKKYRKSHFPIQSALSSRERHHCGKIVSALQVKDKKSSVRHRTIPPEQSEFTIGYNTSNLHGVYAVAMEE